mgnify:FL=1|jgi:hypothetical protein|tara:strand:+ start:439 stop:588 length:150 start_codon:yes stop_codon:yes gene_type:complete
MAFNESGPSIKMACVPVFESKEAYLKNAERPETNKMYVDFIKHLEEAHT